MASKQLLHIGKNEPRWDLEELALPGGNCHFDRNMPFWPLPGGNYMRYLAVTLPYGNTRIFIRQNDLSDKVIHPVK